MASQEYCIELTGESDWDILVSSFQHRTVFHSFAWLTVLQATHGLKLLLVKARRNNRCVGLWPLLQMRKGPLKIIGSPLPGWSTPYLGPLFDDSGSSRGVLSALLEHRLLRGSAYFACKVMDPDDRRIDLTDFGFSQTLRYDTYRLDLTKSEDELWNGFRRECRNHVRKAQKMHVEIREETSPEFIEDYWAMTEETFAKSGVTPTHNRRFIEELWRIGQPRDIVRALSAFHDGQRVSTIVLPHDDRAMYYWGGASYLKYRNLSASNLLQWEGIKLAKRLGKTTYDFISTTGGPGQFKQSFGPEAVNIATHWERSGSRLMLLLKKRYEQYLRRKQRTRAPVPA